MDEWRKEISEIDKKIIQLIRKRLDIVKNIGIYKKENGLPIIQPGQEDAVYKRIEKEAEKVNLNKEEVHGVWENLIKLSRKEQEK